MFWPEVIRRAEWGTYLGEDVTGHAFIDGGVVSNFAPQLLLSNEAWVREAMGVPASQERDVLGLWLDDALALNAPEDMGVMSDHLGVDEGHGKLVGRMERILNVMMSASDLAEARSHPQTVCRLPVKGYGTTEFHMSTSRILHLMDAAADAVDAWMSRRQDA